MPSQNEQNWLKPYMEGFNLNDTNPTEGGLFQSSVSDTLSCMNTSDRPTHKVDGVVRCDICGEIFGSNEAYILHRQTHSQAQGQEPTVQGQHFGPQCTLCGKHFKNNYLVKRHLKSHMSALNAPVVRSRKCTRKCPTCGKLFQSNFHVMRHMKSHSEEKPFYCKICLKSYKHKKDLMNHQESTNHV